MDRRLTVDDVLPRDDGATLVGRAWIEDLGGPILVAVDGRNLRDITALGPTMSHLLEWDNLAGRLADLGGFPDLGPLQVFVDGALAETGDRLLSPPDLQAIKAAGVTFASSMIERVVEERAKGDPQLAESIREKLRPVLGDSLRGLVPGSDKGHGGEGNPRRAGNVVPVSRSRDRTGRGSVLEMPRDGIGRLRCPYRTASEIGLEQSGTRTCPRRRQFREHKGRDARQRRQSARFRRPVGAAPEQGQGQQCVRGDRAVHPGVR